MKAFLSLVSIHFLCTEMWDHNGDKIQMSTFVTVTLLNVTNSFLEFVFEIYLIFTNDVNQAGEIIWN